MKFLLIVLIWALLLGQGATAAPLSIPAPVTKSDANALALLDQSARAYENAPTLDLTFYRGAANFAEMQTLRLRLRRPSGDVHLQNSDGTTAALWTDDRQWRKNQANYIWRSGQHYWKSNLYLLSDVANDWLFPLLGGKNPLRLSAARPDAEQEITLLPARVVRGQKCQGVRRRLWIYTAQNAQERTVWRLLDHEVWLRADNSLLWEVRGQTLSEFNGKVGARTDLLEVRDAKINPPLSADDFVYRLPAQLRAPTNDEVFWSRELRVGALPPMLAPDFRGRTIKLSDFVGRPVVIWFGFPEDDGDLPFARQLARDWEPYEVQVMAVQMETTPDDRKFSFPVALSANDFSGPIIETFGLQRAPFTLVLARDGTIAALNPDSDALETLMFELLKAPDPSTLASRDATTAQLAAQLLDEASRRATLQLWRERALPRPFAPDESAQLLALLPTLSPFEASQLARVLARSHDENGAARVTAMVETFVAAVRGPLPASEPDFDVSLSPRAFVLSEFTGAFAQFDEAERATALQTLARFERVTDADIPDFATWLVIARAACGDAQAVQQLPALIQVEADSSNARVMIRALAQSAGAQAVTQLRALQASVPNRFEPSSPFNLRSVIGDELHRLEDYRFWRERKRMEENQ